MIDEQNETAPTHFDVLIAGMGPVGLTAALVCAQRGFSTCVVGRSEPRMAGRTVALLGSSLDLYDGLGLLPAIRAKSAPLRVMRLVDDTDSPFRSRPLEFRAEEIGLAEFGRNIADEDLLEILQDAAAAAPPLTRISGLLEDVRFSPSQVSARIGARRVSAQLLAAADGRNSPARSSGGIRVRSRFHGQTALTCIFAHDLPHEDVSTEFHTRGGPFTLVPLPGRPEAPHRSSLVWMMRAEEAQRRAALDPTAFARAAERQARSLLGKMKLVSPRGSNPISTQRVGRTTGTRLLLAGDAAHGLPPIGAQGLNLGLRDVAALSDLLARHADPGSPAALAQYERRRRADVSLHMRAVDAMNDTLLAGGPIGDFVRGAGFLALSSIGPLRRATMRIGLGPMNATRVSAATRCAHAPSRPDRRGV